MAGAAGLRLPGGVERIVIHYQCGPDDIPRASGAAIPQAGR
ncbi:hypothetical protein ACH40E_06075 [Streptomyces acidicola]